MPFYSARNLQHTRCMHNDVAPLRTPSITGQASTIDSTQAAGATVASRQDGTYPRPQLVRDAWADLSGSWAMQFDDDNVGLDSGWFDGIGFGSQIRVPFPPESSASGIGDTGFHPVVWYRCDISAEQLEAAGDNSRTVLHFGAVDYRASVWFNGQHVGDHEGGNTPFSFDVTRFIKTESNHIVVRVEDDPFDVGQPRGKQDWQLQPHSIWYDRTTGIWQPVWLETVPEIAITHVGWTADVPNGAVDLELDLSARSDVRVAVELRLGTEKLAAAEFDINGDRLSVRVEIPRQRNGQNYEQLLWSDQTPRLIDARITVTARTSPLEHETEVTEHASAAIEYDTVYSYFGMRSVAIENGVFLLNDRPLYVRSVLSQGYWPDSHLAAPSAHALRAEVELIKSLGFNAARVHQKIEDPRFLYWADKLGLLLWEEMPSVYEFSPTAVRRVMAEWAEVIRRDSSHPSIVTWVPLNESWGVQHIAHSEKVREYSRAIWHQTKALDPTRPVVSNDGWEHLDSDIWSIHDYEESGTVLAARYADAAAVARLFAGMGPAGRRLRLSNEPDRGQPVMLTEFGGVKFSAAPREPSDAWGYSTATSGDDFASRLASLLGAVRSSTVLAGFCYTQLTDTGQEVNGLVTGDRLPKLPVEVIRSIVTGEQSRTSATSVPE
jgi:beta-galactosidase/beta-glucuronidase